MFINLGYSIVKYIILATYFNGKWFCVLGTVKHGLIIKRKYATTYGIKSPKRRGAAFHNATPQYAI